MLRRNSSVALFELQRRPREWWRQKPQHPLPQDVAAAARFTGGSSAAVNDEGAQWTAFNDSAMAQIFSHDVAWMMEREVWSLQSQAVSNSPEPGATPPAGSGRSMCIAACQRHAAMYHGPGWLDGGLQGPFHTLILVHSCTFCTISHLLRTRSPGRAHIH